MSRSRKSRKPRKRGRFLGCGRGCPVCDPDCKLEWFRDALSFQERRDFRERLTEVR